MIDAIVDAELSHIPFIAQTARQPDIEECWKLGATVISEALRASLLSAEVARTWLVNNYPAAMGGVRRLEDGGGIVWLLSSDIVEHYPRRFLVRTKVEFERAQKQYKYLFNYISVDDRRYINWLRWMGFYLYAPEPYGPFRQLCSKFEWRKLNDSSE